MLRTSILYLGPGTGQTERQMDSQSDNCHQQIMPPARYVGGNTIMQWYEQFNVHCADSVPSGFLRVPSMNSWYKLVKQNMEWSVAGLACKQFHKDAHLLVINDEQEQLAVAKMLNGLSLSLLTVVCCFLSPEMRLCLPVCLPVCLSVSLYVCMFVCWQDYSETTDQRFYAMVSYNPQTKRFDFQWPWPKVKVSRDQTGEIVFTNNSVQNYRKESRKIEMWFIQFSTYI